jgi:tetratricopeptide (TPR) repeat protein
LSTLGLDYAARDEHEKAEASLTEAVALLRSGLDDLTQSTVLLNLGLALFARGDHDGAASALRESLAFGRTVERASYRLFAVCRGLVYLGRVETKRGELEKATLLFSEALQTMREAAIRAFSSAFAWPGWRRYSGRLGMLSARRACSARLRRSCSGRATCAFPTTRCRMPMS